MAKVDRPLRMVEIERLLGLKCTFKAAWRHPAKKRINFNEASTAAQSYATASDADADGHASEQPSKRPRQPESSEKPPEEPAMEPALACEAEPPVMDSAAACASPSTELEEGVEAAGTPEMPTESLPGALQPQQEEQPQQEDADDVCTMFVTVSKELSQQRAAAERDWTRRLKGLQEQLKEQAERADGLQSALQDARAAEGQWDLEKQDLQSQLQGAQEEYSRLTVQAERAGEVHEAAEGQWNRDREVLQKQLREATERGDALQSALQEAQAAAGNGEMCDLHIMLRAIKIINESPSLKGDFLSALNL